MGLETTTNRATFAGNDVTTEFSFPYYFLLDADIVVILTDSDGVETTQVITTNYTLSGAGESAGGTVTMLTPPATGETLVVYRDPTQTQGLDLRENDALPAEEVEKSLDKLTMIAQRLSDLVSRTIGLSDGFVDSFTTSLPTDLATANATIVVNATADGWDMGPTTTEIENAEANATAAAASATLASQWASKTDGQVAATDYSAKAWSVGGTGVTDTASAGAAKEWATKTSSTVDTSEYSAKEYAVGTQTRGTTGSAKDWATYTGGTVDASEYSAKYYANLANTTLAAAGVWTKYTVAYTDLSTAGLTNNTELLALAAQDIIHGVVIKHSAQFVGSGVTGVDVSVGITGSENEFSANFDVTQAVADGTRQVMNSMGLENFGSAGSLKLYATATGANLDQLSAGSVDVWVCKATLPS